MTDIPTIAAQLSEAKKRAIRGCLPQAEGAFKLRSSVPWGVIKSFFWADIIDPGYILSPTGLAVRAHLEKEQG